MQAVSSVAQSLQGDDPARRSALPRSQSLERCFNKLKHFRRIATRYDRRASHFLAFLNLAAAMLWN
jgi:transposase